MELHRILQGKDTALMSRKFGEGRIQGGRLSRSRWPGDQNHPVGSVEERGEFALHLSIEAQRRKFQLQVGAIKESKDQRLAERAGQGGKPKVDRFRSGVEVIASCLRESHFGDIHSPQDFQTGGESVLNLFGNQHPFIEKTILPHPNPDNLLLRLDMDIANSVRNGVKQQIIHQLDHRGVLFAGCRQGGGVHRQNGVDGIF